MGFTWLVEVDTWKLPLAKPKWMKETIPGDAKYTAIKTKLRELKLHTTILEEMSGRGGTTGNDDTLSSLGH
jgi:lipoate synthase